LIEEEPLFKTKIGKDGMYRNLSMVQVSESASLERNGRLSAPRRPFVSLRSPAISGTHQIAEIFTKPGEAPAIKPISRFECRGVTHVTLQHSPS